MHASERRLGQAQWQWLSFRKATSQPVSRSCLARTRRTNSSICMEYTHKSAHENPTKKMQNVETTNTQHRIALGTTSCDDYMERMEMLLTARMLAATPSLIQSMFGIALHNIDICAIQHHHHRLSYDERDSQGNRSNNTRRKKQPSTHRSTEPNRPKYHG